MKEPCYGQLEDDRVCNGEPVYRKYIESIRTKNVISEKQASLGAQTG